MSLKVFSKSKALLISSGIALFCFQAVAAKNPKNTSENKLGNPTLLESTWIMPQVSVIMPSELKLKSSNFEVAYGSQFPSLTQAGLLALTPLFNWGGFRVLSSLRLGFSYKAGLFEAIKNNGEVLRDSLKLSWVPMSLGTKFIYSLPNFPFIKPSLKKAVSGGMDDMSGMMSNFMGGGNLSSLTSNMSNLNSLTGGVNLGLPSIPPVSSDIVQNAISTVSAAQDIESTMKCLKNFV